MVDDDNDEQGIIKEDNITPNRSTTIVRNKAPKKPKEKQLDDQPNIGLSAGQKALMDGINNRQKLAVEDLLTAKPDLPVYGEDPVRKTFHIVILLFFSVSLRLLKL